MTDNEDTNAGRRTTTSFDLCKAPEAAILEILTTTLKYSIMALRAARPMINRVDYDVELYRQLDQRASMGLAILAQIEALQVSLDHYFYCAVIAPPPSPPTSF